MGEQATAPVAKKNERDIYFVGPLVDVLVAGGGLSILFFLVVCVVGYGPFTTNGSIRPPVLISIAGMLSFVVNFPHFAATNFRLYQSFDRMMQFPKTSFLSPVVVVAGMAWALVDMNFAPWYAKIFITWSSYHFCAQTKGICLLYARRLGVEIDGIQRKLIVLAAHAPFLYATLLTETYANLGPFYSVTIPTGIPWFGPPGTKLVVPEIWYGWIKNASTAILFAGCAAMVLIPLRTFLRERRLFPIAAAMPLLAQLLWFGPLVRGSQSFTGSQAFNEFVPFFHSFQYLIIAWLFQLKEESARPGFLVGLDTVLWETAKWLLLIIAGGLFLFELVPYLLYLRGYTWLHAVCCMQCAIQIHHFFVDGVIWKIRDPRTRAMLAGNVFDLAGVARVPA
jgi:hypothetical protein